MRHLTRRQTFIICDICGEMKLHKGRGMCSACYMRTRNDGTLRAHPTIFETPVSDFCVCSEPELEPVKMWGTVTLTNVLQCARCLKPPSPA